MDDMSVYKTAKSTRPAWANALIIALIAFAAAIVMTIASGIGVGIWFFGATLGVLIVSGILALTAIGKPKPQKGTSHE